MSDSRDTGDGLISQIVSEFGLKWTQVAVISGLAFSLFGLEEWFNAGAWTLATVLALGTVFAFRRSIDWGLVRVTLASILFAVAYGAGLWLTIRERGAVDELLKEHKLVGTFLLGYGTMIAAAAIALAYRRQESYLGGSYPPSIRKAISNALVDGRFFRRDVRYQMIFKSVDARHTRVEIRLTYELVNRTSVSASSDVVLTPMRPDVEFLDARIGDDKFDVDSPRHRTAAGLIIPVEVPARGSLDIELAAMVPYWSSDSDLFATYLPATSLSLEIQSDLPVKIFVETLANRAVHPVDSEKIRVWRLENGVMPYQGFKVDWYTQMEAEVATGGD